MAKKRASATDTGLPDIDDLYAKTLTLHGLMAVLTDFEPHDTRTRNGVAAVVFAAEDLAEQISTDMEKLSEARL